MKKPTTHTYRLEGPIALPHANDSWVFYNIIDMSVLVESNFTRKPEDIEEQKSLKHRLTLTREEEILKTAIHC